MGQKYIHKMGIVLGPWPKILNFLYTRSPSFISHIHIYFWSVMFNLPAGFGIMGRVVRMM